MVIPALVVLDRGRGGGADPGEGVEHGFAIREEARPFTRIVASWFDAYLNESSVRYSKAV